MKTLISAVVVAAALVAPLASFAQSNQPLTRAEVRAQLVQLEKAGYNPSATDDTTYPVQLQAAEARVAAQNGTAQAATSDIGGVTNGASQSGRPEVAAGAKSIYFGR